VKKTLDMMGLVIYVALAGLIVGFLINLVVVVVRSLIFGAS